MLPSPSAEMDTTNTCQVVQHSFTAMLHFCWLPVVSGNSLIGNMFLFSQEEVYVLDNLFFTDKT